MAKPPEKPAGSIVLSTAAIVDGVYFRAGEPVPYAREADPPPNLKAVVATGEEEPAFSPAERDIYSPHLAREARRIQGNIQLQDWAEQEAEADPLPEDVKEVLEDEHSRRIEKLRAQMAFNQGATDGAYAQAAAAAAAKETHFYVRRGGAWGHVERAKLKPGETVFVKRPNGEMEAAGIIDANGEPPPSEIYL